MVQMAISVFLCCQCAAIYGSAAMQLIKYQKRMLRCNAACE